MQIEQAVRTIKQEYCKVLTTHGIDSTTAGNAAQRAALTFASMLASELVQREPVKVRAE